MKILIACEESQRVCMAFRERGHEGGRRMRTNDISEIAEVKAYLREIERDERIISNKLIELQQLRDLATSTSGNSNSDVVQASGNSDKICSVIVRIVELEEEIKDRINKLIIDKQERITVIESLDNSLEYDVLHKRYIQFKPLYIIADENGYSYARICQIHNSGLLAVAQRLKNYSKL